MPPSVVKNKIANFEAKNHDPSRSVVSTPTSSIVSGNSHEYDVDNDNVDATRTSTSVAASESRKSRIRQQILNPNQLQHPTDLMEKRNQIKERRSMLQQQQVQEENSFDNHDNTSSGRGMTLTRKTGYNTTQLEEGTPVVTPTQDPHDSLRADKNSKVSSNDSSLLRKSPANRMSKMQRMQQRMKGHNHVKRGSPSRSSGGTASAAPSVIQSTATTAVTRNQTQQLQSQSNEQSSQQPRQHDYNFRNNKSGPKHTSQFSPSPPPSPGSKHRIPMDPNGGDHSFINSNNHTISPRSATGTDVLSESQCNIVADASVDPPTDDDATLTSVRRIMENTTSNHHNRQQQQTHYSPSNHSHQQYQSLQAHRKQRGRNESNDYQKPNPIGRKNTNNTYSSNNNSNAFSSNGSYSRNRLQQEYRNGHKVRRHRDWLDEEKSEKEKHRGGVFRTASSSDYDTDGDLSKTSNLSHNNIDNNALDGPSQSQATDVNDFFAARLSYTQPNHKRGITEDDERTFDYGDRDDDSNGSASYATRKLKEAQRRALREEQGKEPQSATFQTSPITELPLLNKDDIEHYKKSMDTPAVKMGAGVAGIATLGCLVFGPLGLLAGAAAVGIGVGVMKLPEEKRSDMQDRATKAMNEFQEKAMDVSDNLSNSCATSSCATTYKESGVAEHFPPCFDLGSDLVENAHESMTQSEIVRGGKNRNPVGSSGGVTKSGAKHPSIPSSKLGEGSLVIPPTSQASSRMRNKKKVACLRNGKHCNVKGFCLSSLAHSFFLRLSISSSAPSSSNRPCIQNPRIGSWRPTAGMVGRYGECQHVGR
jgi:hypothetical protein